MKTISLRLEDRDNQLIKKYAAIHNITVSELVRKTVIEHIENEIDVELFDMAVAETKATYTIDEVKKELDLI